MAHGNQLPTELLYIVVTEVFCDYFDNVVAGSLALPRQNFDLRSQVVPIIQANNGAAEDLQAGNTNVTDNPEGRDDVGDTARQEESTTKLNDELDVILRAAEQLVTKMRNIEDPALKASNPVDALCKSSVCMRSTTLQVLSDALGIPIIDTGKGLQHLESCPWKRIQTMRFYYSNAYVPCAFDLIYDTDDVSGPGRLMASYCLLAMKHARIRQLEEALIQGFTHNPVAILSEQLSNIATLTSSLLRGVKLSYTMEDLRTVKVSQRMVEWNLNATKFLLSEIFGPATRTFFGMIVNYAEAAKMLEASPMYDAETLEDLNSLIEALYVALQSVLVSFLDLASLRTYRPSITEINDTLELANKIVEHPDHNGTGNKGYKIVATQIYERFSAPNFCRNVNDDIYPWR